MPPRKVIIEETPSMTQGDKPRAVPATREVGPTPQTEEYLSPLRAARIAERHRNVTSTLPQYAAGETPASMREGELLEHIRQLEQRAEANTSRKLFGDSPDETVNHDLERDNIPNTWKTKSTSNRMQDVDSMLRCFSEDEEAEDSEDDEGGKTDKRESLDEIGALERLCTRTDRSISITEGDPSKCG